jgi:hypothetical protein
VKKLLFIGLALSTVMYSQESSAQLFRLKILNPGALSNAEIATLQDALKDAEEDINKDLPSASNPKRLMKGMANSSVVAGKGIGSDYASNMDVFLVGAGVGVGADLKKDKESDLSGAGIQGGIILGTNLGWMDTQKILGLETSLRELPWLRLRS